MGIGARWLKQQLHEIRKESHRLLDHPLQPQTIA